MSEKIDIRSTKIICTIGPSTDNREIIKEMVKSGVDIFRLNYSHGTREEHAKKITDIREVSDEVGKTVAILQDLGGPKIRIGQIAESGIMLETGSNIILTPEKEYKKDTIPVCYDYLCEDVKPGDNILMADGKLEVRVTSIEHPNVYCIVIQGGELFSRKGINLPSSNLRIPALTPKDKLDLDAGIEAGVDFVALSFVRNASDILLAKNIIDSKEHRPALIAKIEKPQALECLDEIIELVDGVMVARGDLGVEMPYCDVPVIQKEIIAKARLMGKPVITATQMLSSMVDSPRPTRAEAADVANAIIDGTDALMLSDETAVGNFPINAILALHQIAIATEPKIELLNKKVLVQSCVDISSAIGSSAVNISKELGVKAIFACTQSGSTAQAVSRFRPDCKLLALTPDIGVSRKLMLSWGVNPVICPKFTTTEDTFKYAREYALERGIAVAGDIIVVTAGFPVGVPGSTNLVKVLQL